MSKVFKDSEICKSFSHKDREKIISYIEALYGQKSGLNKIQDLQERKEEAAKKAGLDISKKAVMDILAMKNEEVSGLIFHYLSYFQYSNRFHLLISTQQLFWNIQKILNKPIDDNIDEDELTTKIDNRSSLAKKAKELLAQIEYLYSEIYSDDVKMAAEMEVKKIMTPELRLKMQA